jgi:phage FluMu protein Com
VTQRAIAKASKKKCKVVNKFTIREEETVEYCVVLYGKKSEKKNGGRS